MAFDAGIGLVNGEGRRRIPITAPECIVEAGCDWQTTVLVDVSQSRMREVAHAPFIASWPERQVAWITREHELALWFHSAATRVWLARAFVVAGRLGDGWIWCLLLAPLPWIGGPVGATVAVRMFCVGSVNIVLTKIIKRWIARPRPFRACPGIRECARSLDEFSFPSGHTLHAVACGVILTAYYLLAGFVVWPFALLVACSRIVLGMHYPTDVVAGALIGAAVTAVSFNFL